MKHIALLAAFWLSVLDAAPCDAMQRSPRHPPPMVRITEFRSRIDHIDADWSPDGRRIAYTARGGDGYLDIHLANPDGGDDVNLTAEVPGLPRRHVGGPAWHPGGRYLAVVAEKPEHGGTSFEATPGFAGYSDLWLVAADGSRAARLTDVPNDRDHGVLFGDFSPDGRRMVWAERTAYPNIFVSTFGTTVIKVADFVEGPVPHLANVRTYQPGGEAFYEVYGFSPDGERIIFCSQMGERSVWDQNIFTMRAKDGGDLRKLTESDFNEHAVYTPDGRHIVWMTNKGNSGGTDWWVMDDAGGNKRRLTYMNEKGHSHYAGQPVWAGLVHFSPDGRHFVGGVQTSLTKQVGKIVIVSFLDGHP